jgi:hypothetical protein
MLWFASAKVLKVPPRPKDELGSGGQTDNSLCFNSLILILPSCC